MLQEISITGKAQTGEDVALQEALRQHGQIPAHIAVIMDGNGRWAKERGRSRVVGHHEGVVSVRDVTEACAQLGVQFLTLYTFSTENWYRPESEVNALMQLLIRTIRRERETLLTNGIRLNVLGEMTKLPRACRVELREAMGETAQNCRMTLSLALSYSGRWEILRAVRALAGRVARGELDAEAIDETVFASALNTKEMPDPDLLIRTGGEYRVSNFLLWQIAYTEMFITEAFWPDFRRQQLYEAIYSFQNRERRYGKVKP